MKPPLSLPILSLPRRRRVPSAGVDASGDHRHPCRVALRCTPWAPTSAAHPIAVASHTDSSERSGWSGQAYSFLTWLLLVGASLGSATGCAGPGPRADLRYFPAPPAAPRAAHVISYDRLSEVVPPRLSFIELLRGAPPSPFVETPAGVAVRGQTLYICDTGLNVVHVWDLASGAARRFGASGDAPLHKPVAVAVDDRGHVFTADTGRSEIVHFDSDGREVGVLRPPQRETYRPAALTIHRSELYAADLSTHQIDVFETASGGHLRSFGRGGESGEAPLYYPVAVACDSTGNVYVAEFVDARVRVFDPSGREVRTISQAGDRLGDLGRPKGLAIGPDDTLFIADAEFGLVHVFDQEGHLLIVLDWPVDGTSSRRMPVGLAAAATVPESLSELLPENLSFLYFIFTASTVGDGRISLFAVFN